LRHETAIKANSRILERGVSCAFPDAADNKSLRVFFGSGGSLRKSRCAASDGVGRSVHSLQPDDLMGGFHDKVNFGASHVRQNSHRCPARAGESDEAVPVPPSVPEEPSLKTQERFIHRQAGGSVPDAQIEEEKLVSSATFFERGVHKAPANSQRRCRPALDSTAGASRRDAAFIGQLDQVMFDRIPMRPIRENG